MKNTEKYYIIMLNLFRNAKEYVIAKYMNEYVNTGKMLQVDVYKIVNSDLLKYKGDPVFLAKLYKPFSGETIATKKSSMTVPDIGEFFTPAEISEASFDTTTLKTKFPYKFKIFSWLDPNSFITALSVRDIMAIKTSGLIQWKGNMQRESDVVANITHNGMLISHIHFDPERAKEIGTKIAEGNFYPNTLRWHIVTTDCEYHMEDDNFILETGYIAEIDGQHRNKALEYAFELNNDIKLNFPIIISIGNVQRAQYIIFQDEKRAPISKDKVAQYSDTFGRAVVDAIVKEDALVGDANFMNNAVNSDAMKGALITAIDKYYGRQPITRATVGNVAKWIIEVVNSYYDCIAAAKFFTIAGPALFDVEHAAGFVSLSAVYKAEILSGITDYDAYIKSYTSIFKLMVHGSVPIERMENLTAMRMSVLKNLVKI